MILHCHTGVRMGTRRFVYNAWDTEWRELRGKRDSRSRHVQGGIRRFHRAVVRGRDLDVAAWAAEVPVAAVREVVVPVAVTVAVVEASVVV